MPDDPPHRPDWDAYFMDLARAVSVRATCLRRKVGAVLVRDHRLLTTGYNGSPPGLPHCTDLITHDSDPPTEGLLGCDMHDGHCVRTIHAEANAITQAALHGISTRGATLYTTCSVCRDCAKLSLAAGIARVVFADEYQQMEPLLLLYEAGVEIEHLDG